MIFSYLMITMQKYDYYLKTSHKHRKKRFPCSIFNFYPLSKKPTRIWPFAHQFFLSYTSKFLNWLLASFRFLSPPYKDATRISLMSCSERGT